MTKIGAADPGSDGSSWTMSPARAHFGELLRRVHRRGPQTITR
jgi:hypothetical protein